MSAKAVALAGWAREGHLVRLWRPPVAPGERKALGLYRADGEAQLDGLWATSRKDTAASCR